MRRAIKNPLSWITILTIAYLAILALRPAEAWFGVPGEWTWSGRPPAPSTVPRWWPAIAALALTALAAALLDRRWERLGRRGRALALAGLVLAVPLIQVTLKFIHYRDPVEYYLYRTIGPHNGFWQAAIAIESPRETLRNYPEHMRAAQGVYLHLTTHPPGNILYLWLWHKGFELAPGAAHAVAQWLRGYRCADFGFVALHDAQIAAALGQMLVPLGSGLAALPLYAWGKRLGGARSGWRAAALFALAPNLALFTMRWDTAYPLFAAAAFAALHRGLEERRAGWWLLAGLAVSAATFCSFGNMPLAPGVALYAAGYLWLEGGPRRVLRPWRGWLALIAGGYSVWAVFHALAGVGVWELLRITGGIQASLRGAYSYGRWLLYNAYDILFFVGVPVGAIFAAEAVRAWARVPLRRGADAPESERASAGPGTLLPALAASGVLVAVNLAGVSPGEVGRLWMPWLPAMALAAALWLRRRQRPAPARAFALFAGLLALQSLWMTLFLRVSPTGMPGYQPRAPGTFAQQPQHPLDVTFEDGIRLIGYSVAPASLSPGDPLTVTLHWQAQSRPRVQYTVFVHLVDENGAMLAQHDAMPAGGALPTSCWLPGERVTDAHPLPVPEGADPPYALRVGLYYWPTGTRLSIVAGGQGDLLTLPVTD